MTDRREVFERIIQLIREIIEKNLDPFQVDVIELFEKIKPYVRQLKDPDELVLDAEAVYELSSLIVRQEDWVKHRTSLLYIDPLMALMKIDALSKKELAEIFIKSWHPIIEREQLTEDALRVGIEYWNTLLPLSERALRFEETTGLFGEINEETLLRLGFMSKEEFERVLEDEWKRIKELGRVDYWAYIFDEDYDKTLRKAYIISFLSSYGYVTLTHDPISGEITIIPFEERKRLDKLDTKSLVIAIDRQKWLEVVKKYGKEEKGRGRNS